MGFGIPVKFESGIGLNVSGQALYRLLAPEAAGQLASSVLDASSAGDYRSSCHQSSFPHHGARPNTLRTSISATLPDSRPFWMVMAFTPSTVSFLFGRNSVGLVDAALVISV